MATLFQVPQFFDNVGAPLKGGKLYWHEAGTSIFKDTWVDAAESAPAPNPIILDLEGRVSTGQNGVWIRGSYKLTITDSGDVPVPGGVLDDINEYDSLDFTGLTASIADLNSTKTTATIITGVVTLDLTDRNTTILADATSAAFNINLPAAATAENTYRIFIKKIDPSVNKVTIVTPGIETIDGRSSYELRTLNSEIGIQCDGSNFYTISKDERKNIRTPVATDILALGDERSTILADTSAGSFNVTLPDINVVGSGYRVTVKLIGSTADSVTILPDSIGQTIDGETSLIIPSIEIAYSLISSNSVWYIDSSHGLHTTSELPFGYFAGLYMFPHAGDTAHDTGISIGECRDSLNLVNMELTAQLVKSDGGTWVEGTGKGGFPDNKTLDVDTWYWVFVIAKPDGTTDGGYDILTDGANLLRIGGPAYVAGYRYQRAIGAVLTDSSANIVQYGPVIQSSPRRFRFTALTNDFVDAPPAAAVKTVRCPPSSPSSTTRAYISLALSSPGIHIGNVSMNIGYPSDYLNGASVIAVVGDGVIATSAAAAVVEVDVDAASQITYYTEGVVTNMSFACTTREWVFGENI